MNKEKIIEEVLKEYCGFGTKEFYIPSDANLEKLRIMLQKALNLAEKDFNARIKILGEKLKKSVSPEILNQEFSVSMTEDSSLSNEIDKLIQEEIQSPQTSSAGDGRVSPVSSAVDESNKQGSPADTENRAERRFKR